jgi:threonine dehydrogenase-like Zn-dependent dehydrogenase
VNGITTHHLTDPETENPVAAIKALTHGLGVDMALDTSGASEERLTAVRGTRAWGVVCFVDEGGSVTLDVSPNLLRKQLTIIGSDLLHRRPRGLLTFRRRPHDRC